MKHKTGKEDIFMKKSVMTKILVIGAACLVLGCGKKEEATQEPKEPETEISDDKEVEKEEEAEYKTIGKESEEAYKLLLTNHTGDKITGFTVKASNAEEPSQNLLESGMTIENEEIVCVYYTPQDMDAEAGSEKQAQITYDFSLAYEDGHTVEINGLGLDDIEQAELWFEDEVGFVKYKSADSGKEVSTKETALALKAQKQAEAAAAEQAKKEEAERAQAEAAAAQAQAEAAAAQTQYEQQYYEQPTYEQPVYDQPVYDQPADSGGQDQDVSQSGESCLGGQGVLRY